MNNIVPGDYVKISNAGETGANVSYVYFIQHTEADEESIVALFDAETMTGTVLAVTNWESFDEGFRLDAHNEIRQYVDDSDEVNISLTPQTTTYVIYVNTVCKRLHDSEPQFKDTIVVVPRSSRFVSVEIMQRINEPW